MLPSLTVEATVILIVSENFPLLFGTAGRAKTQPSTCSEEARRKDGKCQEGTRKWPRCASSRDEILAPL